MRLSEEELRKWVRIISDDLMCFSSEDIEHVVSYGKYVDVFLLPNDAGLVGYTIAKDFDCKKKMFMVLFYCRPEYRGRYLRYMFRGIEEIARQEGVVQIFIGDSITGYKSEKFNKMLEYFGYRSSGHIKEI